MPERKAIRGECYQAIRDVMKTGIQNYYQEHKERLLDERSKDAIDRSMEGLKAIFAVLDRYEIARLK